MPRNSDNKRPRRDSWRRAQKPFLRQESRKRRGRFFVTLLAAVVSSLTVTWLGQTAVERLPAIYNPSESESVAKLPEQKETQSVGISESEALLAALANPIAADQEALRAGTRELTLDPSMQRLVQQIFRNTTPLYGAAVVLDSKAGDVLAMVSYRNAGHTFEQPLALMPTFPAASVFKIVTSTAAIEYANAHPHTSLRTVGNPYRLSNQKMLSRFRRGSREISLSEAFAKSNNVAFADLTARYLVRAQILQAAESLGFDREIPFELPLEPSRTFLPDESDYALAKASTGLASNTLSPLHGALIAAAIANGGEMRSPVLFRDQLQAGAASTEESPIISIRPSTARMLSEMMEQTIRSGTARKSFAGSSHSTALKDSRFGGKTGSLTSDLLNGHCEWFVGYGKRASRRLAVAVVMVTGPQWKVKPAYVARKIFEEGLSQRTTLASR